MTGLIATPVYRVAPIEADRAELPLGMSVIELGLAPGAAWTPLTPAVLEFDVVQTPLFTGQRATLKLFWQAVPVGAFPLNSFGPTHIRVVILAFDTPCRLQFEINCEHSDGFYAGDFNAFSTACAQVSSFAIQPFRIHDDVRLSLVGAARHLAKGLGLMGTYMDDPGRLAPLADVTLAALRERRGFALVRLGDAEGRLLNFQMQFVEQEVLSQVLFYHFGPDSLEWIKANHGTDWISAAVLPLQQMVRSSLLNADAVGLPVEETLDEEALAADPFGALGYASALMAGLALTRHIPAKLRFGYNVFQQVAGRGLLLRDLAQAAKSVHLVGPWDISLPFAEAVGLKNVHHIAVPGHYTWRGGQGLGHYPELHKFVEQRIVALGDLSGSLLLVGAGILGKHYCNLAKTRGAVALDIGAIFDSWAQKGIPYAVANKHISLDKLRGGAGS